MNDLKYINPRSLSETMALISEYQGRAKIIAGGTDLLARMKKGISLPEVLVNVECVDELHYIRRSPKSGLLIGAATSLAAVEKSDLVTDKFAVLAQAVGSMGCD